MDEIENAINEGRSVGKAGESKWLPSAPFPSPETTLPRPLHTSPLDKPDEPSPVPPSEVNCPPERTLHSPPLEFPSSLPSAVPSSVVNCTPERTLHSPPSEFPSSLPSSVPSSAVNCPPERTLHSPPSEKPSSLPSSAPSSVVKGLPERAISTGPSHIPPSEQASNIPSSAPPSVVRCVPPHSQVISRFTVTRTPFNSPLEDPGSDPFSLTSEFINNPFVSSSGGNMKVPFNSPVESTNGPSTKKDPDSRTAEMSKNVLPTQGTPAPSDSNSTTTTTTITGQVKPKPSFSLDTEDTQRRVKVAGTQTPSAIGPSVGEGQTPTTLALLQEAAQELKALLSPVAAKETKCCPLLSLRENKYCKFCLMVVILVCVFVFLLWLASINSAHTGQAAHQLEYPPLSSIDSLARSAGRGESGIENEKSGSEGSESGFERHESGNEGDKSGFKRHESGFHGDVSSIERHESGNEGNESQFEGGEYGSGSDEVSGLETEALEDGEDEGLSGFEKRYDPSLPGSEEEEEEEEEEESAEEEEEEEEEATGARVTKAEDMEEENQPEEGADEAQDQSEHKAQEEVDSHALDSKTNAGKIKPRILRVIYLSALQCQEGRDILLGRYLDTYKHLLNFFHIFGTFGSVRGRVLESCLGNLERYIHGAYSSHYVTLAGMVHFEDATGTIGRVSPFSGTTLFINLQRHLEFMTRCLANVLSLRIDMSLSYAFQTAYQDVLARHKEWFVVDFPVERFGALPTKQAAFERLFAVPGSEGPPSPGVLYSSIAAVVLALHQLTEVSEYVLAATEVLQKIPKRVIM